MEQERLKTGFRELDGRWIGGIKRRELVVIYSSVVTQTAFLSQMLINMIFNVPPIKCIYFTFGEGRDSIYNKMTCIKSGVAYDTYFECESRSEKEGIKIKEARQWLNEKLCAPISKVHIIDNAYTLAEIFLCVAEAKASFGLDVVFIDGLCFLKDYANEDIRYALSILKDLSVRLDIAVIVGDYFRFDEDLPAIRQIKNKYVFRKADKVVLSIRPEVYATSKQLLNEEVPKGVVDFHVLKNQTGERSSFSLKFDVGTLRFYNPRDIDLDECEPPIEKGSEGCFFDENEYEIGE